MEAEVERRLAAADAAKAAAFATALAAATATATATAAHPTSETAYDAWLGTVEAASHAEAAAPEEVALRAELAARSARAVGRGDARYSVVGAPHDGSAARIGGVGVGGGYADAGDGGARKSSLERLSTPVRRPQSAGAQPSAERMERVCGSAPAGGRPRCLLQPSSASPPASRPSRSSVTASGRTSSTCTGPSRTRCSQSGTLP